MLFGIRVGVVGARVVRVVAAHVVVATRVAHVILYLISPSMLHSDSVGGSIPE
jgi:hypothetical protein